MEPFISGITQLFWDLLNDCAGFYHIVYNPNPITKPNGFDNPLPISIPNCFHNRNHIPKPPLNVRIHFLKYHWYQGATGVRKFNFFTMQFTLCVFVAALVLLLCKIEYCYFIQ